MRFVGIGVFALGVFFFCGNIFGFFPTFPGLGYLTMALGGYLLKR